MNKYVLLLLAACVPYNGTARCQITLNCETPYSSSDTYGFIQMHQGSDQDWFLYKLSQSEVRVFQTPCAGATLWQYSIPPQFQAATSRSVWSLEVTGDNTYDFVCHFYFSDRVAMVIVDAESDATLLTLNDANTSYGYNFSRDVDHDGLSEILVSVSNHSTGQHGVQVWNTNGSAGLTPDELPGDFSLSPAFPNPFNSSVSIPFVLEHPGNVEIKVYDVLGHEIANLSKANASFGAQTVEWDARMMPSGSYFYSVFVNNERVGAQRVILLK